MTATVERGPHVSALSNNAVEYAQKEAADKVRGGYVTIVNWDDIKDDPPQNLKISLISLTPHKSRSY